VLGGDIVLVLRACENVEPEVPGFYRHPACGGGKPVKIDLAGIDAPEKVQAGAWNPIWADFRITSG
jgi:endonuclease YncB( thermonuclease family)